jgi:hypothetical protein
LRLSCSTSRSRTLDVERTLHERTLDDVQAALSPEELDGAWAEGRSAAADVVAAAG